MGEEVKVETIYINGNEVLGISDFEITGDAVEDYVRANIGFDTATLTYNCRINRMLLYKFIGFWNWVIDSCPNKRVVHLMKHGKNDRVKYKNFIRAIRILGKILEVEVKKNETYIRT